MAAAYEKDKDYQALINAAAASGDFKSAAQYEQQRNAKIQGEGITKFGTTNNYSQYLNYDPSTDYNSKASALYSAGDITGAYDALFGSSNSREAKISGIGTDYGTTSQSIWDSLVANTNSNNLMKQVQNAITQLQNQDYSYGGNGNYETAQQILDLLTQNDYSDWKSGDQYQALSDLWGQQGKMAMQDVLGQISSRTGGLASSYAATAAQQQYNYYMAQLEEAAQKQYGEYRNDLLENAQLANNMGDAEYQRYLDQLSAEQSGQSTALNALYELLGYKTNAEDTEYNKGQTAKTDAQNRIYDYLVNQGGSVGNLGAELITASGYTTAELNAMEAKYQQNMAASAAKSSGGGSGGGSSEMDYEGLFAAAKASGNPKSWLSQEANYKKYGFSSSSGLYSDYENWLDTGTEETGGADPTITNRHGDSWVYIPGHGRFSYQEIYNYVESGKVIETVDKDNNTVSYKWYTNKAE